MGTRRNPEVRSMMTIAKLKTRTVKDLAAMARKKKVSGWHTMRKDELITALLKTAARAARQNGSAAVVASTFARPERLHNGASAPHAAAKKPTSPRLARRLDQIKAKLVAAKDLAIRTVDGGNGHVKDRLVVMVRDPYWLHAYWELSRRSIERARAAMGQHWHEARPILRSTRSAATARPRRPGSRSATSPSTAG